MSKATSLFLLFAALISAFVATSIVRKYINSQRLAYAGEVATDPVVMAAYQMPAGSTIRKEQITVAHLPKGSVPPQSFQSVDNVVGRVVSSTIFPGEMVLNHRLEQPGAISGLSALIPKGLRAITLKVDDTSSVAGFIQPGNYVDVVTTVQAAGVVDEPISKVILQNVKVIATGQEIERTEDNKKGKVIPTVTVLATLEQSERLSLASNAGTIRLVLRNYADQSEEQTAGTTLASLIPQANEDPAPPQPLPVLVEEKSEPTPKPRPVKTVYIHKGREVSEYHF